MNTILFVFFSVIIGISIGNVLPKNSNFQKLLLVFSAGFLLMVCVNELFPEIYMSGGKNMGLWVIVGVLIQILLEFFSKGAEHGHMHLQQADKVPLGIISGLIIHSFIEGIPLGNTESQYYIPDLWLAVALHKLPIAILYASFIRNLNIDTRLKYSLYMLFAIATPVGMYMGSYIPDSTLLYLYAINGGIFLHISSLIIFESNQNHNFNYQKLAALILGFVGGYFI